MNPTALIIGAGKGIGRATAIELVKRNYRVAIVARTASDLEATAKLAKGALVIPADASEPDEIDSVVAGTMEAFGRIDLLINSAGYAPVLSLEQVTPEKWRDIIDINLSSVIYSCRAVWPAMKSQNSGVIVNLSSMASRDPFAGLGAYGAAKAGVNLLGLALAREGAPHNIRVHTLALGSVETQMLRQIVTEEQFPRSKTIDPAEIAQIIADCATGSLRYTSGEVIYIHKTM